MSTVQRYWSEKAKSLTPYVPGEQPADGERWIKLNTNENPYPPSPKALEAGKKPWMKTCASIPIPIAPPWPQPARPAMMWRLNKSFWATDRTKC